MSWSFSCIGKPAAVAAAIEKHGETMSGQSRLEFEDARPHLVALVSQNFKAADYPHGDVLIDFEASGSGTSRASGVPGVEPVQVQRNCSVSIKPIHKTIV